MKDLYILIFFEMILIILTSKGSDPTIIIITDINKGKSLFFKALIIFL